jgi:hypothetical protein
MSRNSILILAATAVLGVSAAAPASAGMASASLGHFAGASKPGVTAFAASSQTAARPGSWAMLNPQPLPPRVQSSASRPGGWAMINPQPLPPRIAQGGAFR